MWPTCRAVDLGGTSTDASLRAAVGTISAALASQSGGLREGLAGALQGQLEAAAAARAAADQLQQLTQANQVSADSECAHGHQQCLRHCAFITRHAPPLQNIAVRLHCRSSGDSAKSCRQSTLSSMLHGRPALPTPAFPAQQRCNWPRQTQRQPQRAV